jgi:Domain of unknown function (DUF6458)
MGYGVSLFLIALGAILYWAVNATVSGLEISTLGVILMVVGAAGLLLSLLFFAPWARTRTRRERVEDDRGVGYDRVERVSDRGL